MSTSKYHHGDLRHSLIRAGAELLRARGPTGLTLRAAARAAGVSPTATYRHFADKNALLAAIAAEGFAELEQALRAADLGSDGRAALNQQGAAYVAFAIANPHLFRLMFAGVQAKQTTTAACGEGTLLPAPQGAFGVLAARIAQIAPPGETETAIIASWSIVHGLAALILDQRITAADPSALAARVAACLDVDAK